MSKTIRTIGNISVTVVSPDSSNTVISKSDAEMDIRAKAAVKSAIGRAKACKKPIAKYDRKRKRAYIETANGEKKYV